MAQYAPMPATRAAVLRQRVGAVRCWAKKTGKSMTMEKRAVSRRGDVDGEADEHGGPETFEREDGADAEERGVREIVGVPVVGGGAEGDGDGHDDEDEDVGEPPGIECAAAAPPEGGEHEGGERGEAEQQAHELLGRDGLVEERADLDGDGVAGGDVAEGRAVAGPAHERHKEDATLVGEGGAAEGVLAPVEEGVVDEEVGAGGLDGGEREEEGDEPVASAEWPAAGRGVWGGGDGSHTAFTVQDYFEGPAVRGGTCLRARGQGGRSWRGVRGIMDAGPPHGFVRLSVS